ADAEFGKPVITPLVAGREMARAIGPEIAIVDEAPTTLGALRAWLRPLALPTGLEPCFRRERGAADRPTWAGRALSARPAVRGWLARYASVFLTRSGVNGAWRKRAPVSWAIALPIAGVTNGVAICPTPVGGLAVDITSMCISGTSLMRGIR